ncbi:hypothetical protein [Streptomyces sp. NPDC020747]|uniref:hypothetical protein n=1 Tax=Streptomyces sp. NPDC020747 TaxID=3365086 RepID=UPI0037BD6ABC
MALDRSHRLDAVSGLRDDLDVGLCLEDHGEPAADQFLVVGDHHADAHPRAACRPTATGRRTTIRKPPVGVGARDGRAPAGDGPLTLQPTGPVLQRRGVRPLETGQHPEPVRPSQYRVSG